VERLQGGHALGHDAESREAASANAMLYLFDLETDLDFRPEIVRLQARRFKETQTSGMLE
jgi:hypothetical protein